MKIKELIGRGMTPYFKVTVPDNTMKNQKAAPAIPLISNSDIRNKVYSLKIEEKEGCPPTINLTLLDDTGRINKKYSHGVKCNVEWGLKQGSLDVFQRLSKPSSKAISEIRGNYRRGPVLCHMMNYSVSGSDGIAVASLSMRGGLQGGYAPRTRLFSGVTMSYAIKLLAVEMGMQAVINFPGMDDALTNRSALRQSNETNFSFLRRMSFKFNCKFVTQTDPMTLYFVAWDRDQEINYAENRGFTGNVWALDYGSSERTIMSFSIDQNSGANNGSTISIVTAADGTSHASFSPSAEESTTIWELDSGKIKAALKARKFSDQMALIGEIESAGYDDLDRLKKLYFTKRTATTAPEGGGYTAKMKIVPNPDMQVGDRIFLGSKSSLIPPQFKSRFSTEPIFSPVPKPGVPNLRTLWRITSIEQSIDASDYTFEIEAAR